MNFSFSAFSHPSVAVAMDVQAMVPMVPVVKVADFSKAVPAHGFGLLLFHHHPLPSETLISIVGCTVPREEVQRESTSSHLACSTLLAAPGSGTSWHSSLTRTALGCRASKTLQLSLALSDVQLSPVGQQGSHAGGQVFLKLQHGSV